MFTRITLKNSFFKEKREPVGAGSLLLPGKEVRGMTKIRFLRVYSVTGYHSSGAGTNPGLVN